MKVYISGPMTGLAELNFPAFHAAAKAWRDAGWDVLNPAESFNGDTTLSYVTYADHDITQMQECDAIAMLPGWDGKGARGSVWEYLIALRLLGLRVFDALKPVNAADEVRAERRAGLKLAEVPAQSLDQVMEEVAVG